MWWSRLEHVAAAAGPHAMLLMKIKRQRNEDDLTLFSRARIKDNRIRRLRSYGHLHFSNITTPPYAVRIRLAHSARRCYLYSS